MTSQRPSKRELSATAHHSDWRPDHDARSLLTSQRPSKDEWLVGRRYLSAESISLVLAGPDDHTDKEIKEEVPELPGA